MSADYLGSSGGDGIAGNAGTGGGGGGSGGLVLTGVEVSVQTDGHAVTGGIGGRSAGSGFWGTAGGGGAGLVLLQGGALAISGGSAIAGGLGGGRADYGGGGGAGLFLYAGGALINQAGSIRGGNGGGEILFVYMGGDGGAGVLSNLGTIANEAVIIGGDGGVGRSMGGNGGIGVVAWGGSIDNAANGVISGGQGATIRDAGRNNKAGGGGGGIWFRDGQAASLTNAGTVEGGAAGATPFGDNVVGAGGVGVTGAATGNISIINSGTITGGLNSRNAVRSDAITLFGSGNRVELRAGSTINGNVVVSGGSDNALVLGGSANSGMDVSLVSALAQYRGFDRFEKVGASNWTLTGAGSQDWLITSGTLKGDTNSLSGSLGFGTSDGGRGAIFDQAFNGTYGGVLSGDGVVTKSGTGAVTMTGVPAPGDKFTGLVQVDGGTLVLNGTLGDRAGKTAQLRVGTGAMLGGSGTFLGDVTVADGGIVGPGTSPGTLTITGNYTLGAGSVLRYELGQPGVVGSATNDLIVVGGNLTLDGSLDLTALPDFGAGYYRLIDYAGSLTDNGLELGTTPPGFTGTVQTGIAGQVNILFNDGAQRVQYWDGTDATGRSAATNGDGGMGVWRAGSTNWTAASGFGINDGWAGQAGVFAGTAGGTVTIEGRQSFQRLRFDTAGYVLQSGALVTTGDFSIIEVNAATTINSAIAGIAGLTKTGAGALTMGGANSYTGRTTVSAGSLSLAAGGLIAGAVHNEAYFSNAGTVNGSVTNAGAFASTGTLNGNLLNQGTASLAGQVRGSIENHGTVALTGALSGVTRLNQVGGSLNVAGFEIELDVLDGEGSIALGGGTLMIGSTASSSVFDGMIAGGGTVTIAAGSFEGSGSIDATMVVVDGAHLRGVRGSTLSVGSLILAAGSQLDVALGAPLSAPLFDIDGNLTLDGTVNVSASPAFGAGVYRLFDYRGVLTDNGLELGAVAGAPGGQLSIQSGAGHVNLVNTAGVTLAFWDGGAAGFHNNGAVDGGNGTWSTGSANWTAADGKVNSAMAPQPGFAVFQGSAGTVMIDNTAGQVSATGMQFATNGYTLEGGPLALTGERAVMRVGDGSAAGAGMRATVAAPLTGPATLVKSDLGTLVLTGSNSYSGGTIVEAGTLVGDTNGLRGNIANRASLVFDLAANGTFDGSVTGTGKTMKSGAGALTLAGANASDWQVLAGSLITTSTLFTGDVDLKQGASLVFDQTREGAYGATITGNGSIAVRGGGAIRFTGNGSAFLGTTNVGGGQLLTINGTLGGTLDIAAGGRLQGSGTAGSVNVAGTIAPGNSIGTLTLGGNLALTSGSIYEVEADATGASDRIIVGGTATIGSNVGMTVLAADGNYAARTNYTVLSASGGVTGTFAAVTSNLAFLTPTLNYSANAVTLNLRRNTVDFATVGQTHNQAGVAPAVEALGSGNRVYDAVVALTAPEARDAFDQLAGSDYASVRGQLLEDSRFVRDAMLARGQAAGGSGVALWGRVLGSRGSINDNIDAPGYERDLEGLLTGFDGPLGESLRAGVAVGYGTTDIHIRRGRHEIRSYHAGGYFMGGFGVFSFQLGGAYAWNDVEATRRIAFGTFDQILSSEYAARTFQTFGEVALRGELGGVMLQPFASVARVSLFDARVREQGGGATLRGGDGRARVTWGNLGIRTRADLGMNDIGLRFAGSAALRHAFGDRSANLDLAFTSGAAFNVVGAGIERDSIAVDGGLEADLTRDLALSISYMGNYGNSSTDHGGRVSLNWQF
ncbi:autotransporter domain-containing protein [Sphingomonas psychrotolerans]|uniref:Autotransporter domain-containing protein n=1 Tax=Sphingomonas psychrotolerans TaxID=1327635 RepID=A0A2K8MEY0_9SPHN|nr:autotransporter domain-containing protein [Sphingomonas psychrotolerans]ATY31086.1 hypothetical protein CVN68_03050 [Sphingomonas psychrotolerans]